MTKDLPKLFINSYPKSGTNLVQKLVEVAGFEYSKKSIALSSVCGRYGLVKRVLRSGLGGTGTLPIGLEMNASASYSWLNKYLSNVGTGEYVTGHCCYSDGLKKILTDYGFKIIQVLRDPYDLALSTARYVVEETNTWYPFYSHMKELSEAERIKLFFEGGYVGRSKSYYESYQAVRNKLHGWESLEGAKTIWFEDLVACNEGDIDKWTVSIANLMSFLEVPTEFQVSEEVFRKRVFGKSHTFRGGKVGEGRKVILGE